MLLQFAPAGPSSAYLWAFLPSLLSPPFFSPSPSPLFCVALPFFFIFFLFFFIFSSLSLLFLFRLSLSPSLSLLLPLLLWPSLWPGFLPLLSPSLLIFSHLFILHPPPLLSKLCLPHGPAPGVPCPFVLHAVFWGPCPPHSWGAGSAPCPSLCCCFGDPLVGLGSWVGAHLVHL